MEVRGYVGKQEKRKEEGRRKGRRGKTGLNFVLKRIAFGPFEKSLHFQQRGYLAYPQMN